MVTYPRHGASLRHDITEIFQISEYLLFAHRIGIFPLYPGDFGGYAVVHVVGGQLKNVSERIFECVFADPYAGGKFVTVEIFHACLIGFVITIGLASLDIL